MARTTKRGCTHHLCRSSLQNRSLLLRNTPTTKEKGNQRPKQVFNPLKILSTLIVFQNLDKTFYHSHNCAEPRHFIHQIPIQSIHAQTPRLWRSRKVFAIRIRQLNQSGKTFPRRCHPFSLSMEKLYRRTKNKEHHNPKLGGIRPIQTQHQHRGLKKTVNSKLL